MTVRRACASLLALLAALNSAIIVVRIVSVVRYARLVPLPIEGPGLYTLWRIRHGWPMYEWPDREFFSLSLYNGLFYQLYARTLGLVRVADDWTPVAARFITLAAACAGAWLLYRVIAAASERRMSRVERLGLVALASVPWIGSGLAGWWALAIRADMIALVFSTAALSAAVAADRQSRRDSLLLAGVLFYLAWACKQSQVGFFAGTVAYLLVWRRSAREALRVAAPFAILVAATLAFGGERYRANVIHAAAVGDLIPWLAFHNYRSLFLPNVLIWILPAIVIVVHRRVVREPPPGAVLTAFAAAAAFAMGFVLQAKAGSDVNHALEFGIGATALCGMAFAAELPPVAARWRDVAALLLLVPMVLFAAATLSGERGTPAIDALRLYARGHRSLTLQAEAYRERSIVERRLAGLPKPIFIDDEIFALPWFATGNRYPALVLDHVYYDTAVGEGRIVGGFEGLVRQRHFASLVVATPPWRLERIARQSGYVRSGAVVLDGATWRILIRRELADPSQQTADEPQYAVPERRSVR